jgi:hypothetical protein
MQQSFECCDLCIKLGTHLFGQSVTHCAEVLELGIRVGHRHTSLERVSVVPDYTTPLQVGCSSDCLR